MDAFIGCFFLLQIILRIIQRSLKKTFWCQKLNLAWQNIRASCWFSELFFSFLVLWTFFFFSGSLNYVVSFCQQQPSASGLQIFDESWSIGSIATFRARPFFSPTNKRLKPNVPFTALLFQLISLNCSTSLIFQTWFALPSSHFLTIQHQQLQAFEKSNLNI